MRSPASACAASLTSTSSAARNRRLAHGGSALSASELIVGRLNALGPQVHDALAPMMRGVIGGQEQQFHARHLAGGRIEGLHHALVLEAGQRGETEIGGIFGSLPTGALF